MQTNYWIFQARTDRFDLRDPDRIIPGQRDDWVASRYRSYMKPGDIVFFWLAGPAEIRGIYGWGKLVSTPYPKGDDDFRVDVEYKRRLQRFISVHELESNSALQDLQIIRIAIGTNFLINASEARAICELIRPPDVAPEIEL